MADGSIAGAEPRKTEPAAPPSRVIQKGPDADETAAAATSVGINKVAEVKAKEPLRELIDKLGRTEGMVARVDPALAATIRGIAAQVDTPGRNEEPMFRTKVAYALQDVEKLAGPVYSVPQGLREEMARLAATSPGLQNERMQDLMRSTSRMDDRGLVRIIRRDAAEVARASDQASPDLQSKIEVLENRARLGTRAGSPAQATKEQSTASDVQSSGAGVAKQLSRQNEAAIQNDSGALPPDRRLFSVAQTTGTQQVPTADQNQPQRGIGATFAIMSALRKPEPKTPAPWDQQLTPLKGRITRYVETAQANEEEASLRAAERSGQAAVQALQAFANGLGASIMSKIQAASKADPDGMAGVAAGMRPGGPYADLRQTFNADLAREKGLATALDRASAAVSQYGTDRTVADGIATGRADASVITARFAKLDAQVGKAASETPNRKDGKSQMEELGEKAAQLASKAVEAVKAAFKRIPGSEQRPSAGPSPT